MAEYTHVCIDKAGVGLDVLRQDFANHGIQTAQARGIVLAAGSIRLEHHLHVFLWDESSNGVKRRRDLLTDPDSFLVRVRWTHLTKEGIIFSGTLKGDTGHAGPPAGRSTNGGWAYRGGIPANYCFVEGHHTTGTAGFEDWRSGRGWDGNG